MGDKSLNLPVRQVEPAHKEIVFCKHQEATEEPAEALLWLMLTGADITDLCILPAAMTYMRANPERASEIWQYVYCINTVALSYHWDGVAYCDATFR